MKTALITGIGGSIGVHVLAHLMHNTDWNVVGIDSFRHKGLVDRVTEVSKGHPEWNPRIKIVTHDLRAPISDLTQQKIGPVDYIINLASRSDVDASIIEPEQFILDNVQSTLTMLEYARKVKPSAFVQFSTDEVYGPSGENDGHVEWSPIIPSNPYSASKAMQEAAAISYWRTFAVPLIITNTMNNFGEMQQPAKFPAMIQKKIAAGETVTIHGTREKIGSRYYLHSRNAADAVLFILKNTTPYMHQDGEIDRPDRYNIVGDKRVSNLELVQMIADLMEKPFRYEFIDFHKTRPGHDRHYGLDGTKLKSLGWKAPIDFAKSLLWTIKWQEKHPEWLHHRS